MKKITKYGLEEIPMVTLGTGTALMGSSLVVIGIMAAKKNLHSAGVVMAFGAFFAHAGYQVTIGAVERIMGKRP